MENANVPEAQGKRYMHIPAAVFEKWVPRLTPSTSLVLIALIYHKDMDESHGGLTVKEISDLIGRTIPTVTTSVKELMSHGLIYSVERPLPFNARINWTTIYRVNDLMEEQK